MNGTSSQCKVRGRSGNTQMGPEIETPIFNWSNDVEANPEARKKKPHWFMHWANNCHLCERVPCLSPVSSSHNASIELTQCFISVQRHAATDSPTYPLTQNKSGTIINCKSEQEK